MKKIINSKKGLLFFGLFSSLIAEIIELFSGLGQYGQLLLGLGLSLLILYLSIKWEYFKNINSFFQIIKNIIPDIKLIRKKNNISGIEIQTLMVNLVSGLGEKFDLTRFLEKDTKKNDENTVRKILPCSICDESHSCGNDGKCLHCKLSSMLWAELEETN